MNQMVQKTVDGVLDSGLSIHLMGPKKLEVKLTGYSHKLLPKTKWKILSEENEVVALSDWIEWQFGGGKAVIHGFYIKDKSNDVIWEKKFKEPVEVLRKGDKLRIRPKITFGEE